MWASVVAIIRVTCLYSGRVRTFHHPELELLAYLHSQATPRSYRYQFLRSYTGKLLHINALLNKPSFFILSTTIVRVTMAVLDSCPGIEVSIVLNNKVLKEYRDLNADHPQNSTTSCIEIEAAAAFEVDLEVTDTYPSRHGILVEVRLDGKKIEDILIRVEDLHKSGGHKFTGATAKINGWWFTSDPSFVKFVSSTYTLPGE
jgi:hypothetical protein